MAKLSEQQFLFAKNVAKLINYIFDYGYSCTLGEVYRTIEQAEIYVKQRKGIKDSQHCKRLAIDLNLFSPEGEYLQDTESYASFGKFWKTLSPQNRWGGDFSKPDGNHFEMQEI